MSNRYKFRVWDKKYKQMYEGDIRVALAYPDEDVTIMQSTGRTDINKKVIWGGSIVQGKLSFEGGVLPTMGVVEYCSNVCAFGLRNEGGLTLFHNHILSSFEVIGDIYRSPELLLPKSQRTKQKND